MSLAPSRLLLPVLHPPQDLRWRQTATAAQGLWRKLQPASVRQSRAGKFSCALLFAVPVGKLEFGAACTCTVEHHLPVDVQVWDGRLCSKQLNRRLSLSVRSYFSPDARWPAAGARRGRRRHLLGQPAARARTTDPCAIRLICPSRSRSTMSHSMILNIIQAACTCIHGG